MDKASLEKCIEDFRKEVHELFPENSREPASKGDLSELARHTYYVFNEILKTLD